MMLLVILKFLVATLVEIQQGYQIFSTRKLSKSN